MYRVNDKGPKTEPCGTPPYICFVYYLLLLRLLRNMFLNKFGIGPNIQIGFNLTNNVLYSINNLLY